MSRDAKRREPESDIEEDDKGRRRSRTTDSSPHYSSDRSSSPLPADSSDDEFEDSEEEAEDQKLAASARRNRPISAPARAAAHPPGTGSIDFSGVDLDDTDDIEVNWASEPEMQAASKKKAANEAEKRKQADDAQKQLSEFAQHLYVMHRGSLSTTDKDILRDIEATKTYSLFGAAQRVINVDGHTYTVTKADEGLKFQFNHNEKGDTQASQTAKKEKIEKMFRTLARTMLADLKKKLDAGQQDINMHALVKPAKYVNIFDQILQDEINKDPAIKKLLSDKKAKIRVWDDTAKSHWYQIESDARKSIKEEKTSIEANELKDDQSYLKRMHKLYQSLDNNAGTLSGDLRGLLNRGSETERNSALSEDKALRNNLSRIQQALVPQAYHYLSHSVRDNKVEEPLNFKAVDAKKAAVLRNLADLPLVDKHDGTPKGEAEARVCDLWAKFYDYYTREAKLYADKSTTDVFDPIEIKYPAKFVKDTKQFYEKYQKIKKQQAKLDKEIKAREAKSEDADTLKAELKQVKKWLGAYKQFELMYLRAELQSLKVLTQADAIKQLMDAKDDKSGFKAKLGQDTSGAKQRALLTYLNSGSQDSKQLYAAFGATSQADQAKVTDLVRLAKNQWATSCREVASKATELQKELAQFQSGVYTALVFQTDDQAYGRQLQQVGEDFERYLAARPAEPAAGRGAGRPAPAQQEPEDQAEEHKEEEEHEEEDEEADEEEDEDQLPSAPGGGSGSAHPHPHPVQPPRPADTRTGVGGPPVGGAASPPRTLHLSSSSSSSPELDPRVAGTAAPPNRGRGGAYIEEIHDRDPAASDSKTGRTSRPSDSGPAGGRAQGAQPQASSPSSRSMPPPVDPRQRASASTSGSGPVPGSTVQGLSSQRRDTKAETTQQQPTFAQIARSGQARSSATPTNRSHPASSGPRLLGGRNQAGQPVSSSSSSRQTDSPASGRGGGPTTPRS